MLNCQPVMWFALTPPPPPLPEQTAKDDTAYTQVSDKPEEPSDTHTAQPMRNGSYIAMSPVEAQKCWWRLPGGRGSGRGLREQCRRGFTHSGLFFTFWLAGWDTGPSKCLLIRTWLLSLSPLMTVLYSTCWVWPLPPAVLHHNKLWLSLPSLRPGWPSAGVLWRTLGGRSQGKHFVLYFFWGNL